MKKTSSFVMMVGATLGFLMLSACGGGAPVDDDSPEGIAFQYRDAVMHVLANKLVTINAMAREEIPLDEALFVKTTADAASLAGMLLEGFETEGVAAGSRALPDIWANWDDFAQRFNDLEQASIALAEAAANGGFAAAQGLVQGTASTCGACHRTYRRREE